MIERAAPILPDQLKRLQTLYSKFAAGSADPVICSREERLLWASRTVGRRVASFNNSLPWKQQPRSSS
jgi:hypothetical protein